MAIRIPAKDALAPSQSELEAVGRGWLEPGLVDLPVGIFVDNGRLFEHEDRRDRKFTVRLKVV